MAGKNLETVTSESLIKSMQTVMEKNLDKIDFTVSKSQKEAIAAKMQAVTA